MNEINADALGVTVTSDHLEGRRVLVTGAGSGLGEAYAVAIAAAGASVLVNDLDPEQARTTAERITAAGGHALDFAGDVGDWETAQQMVQACVTGLGGIDGLVNNAGIVGRLRPMHEETEDIVRRVFHVNAYGTLFPSVHAARAMVAAGEGGAIVNVSSGNQCGHALLTTYGASKGAVASFTYGWAVDLAEHGIRVNAISPNAHTGQIDDAVSQLGFNPEARDYPLPEHNAAVVTYLLSDAANELTGQIVRCDYGYVSLMAHPLVAEPRVPLTEWSVESVASGVEKSAPPQLLGVAIATVSGATELH